MGKNIRGNYAYNLAYQILGSAMAFVSIPYASRVLGADNIGIYSYTSAVTSYFVMVVSFGTAMWGQREIACAQVRHDTNRKAEIFYEIILLRTFLGIVALSIYGCFICLKSQYFRIYAVQAISIISVIFDISWFFQGIEEFRKIVLRNIVTKILGVCALFLFVRSETDLLLYVWIQVAVMLVGNIALWFGLSKYLDRISRIHINPFAHIRILSVFFVLQVIVQVHAVIDRTVLGYLGNNVSENGYYEQAYKIITMSQIFFNAFIAVLLPRISGVFSIGQKKHMDCLVRRAARWITRLSCPFGIGLCVIAENFTGWFLGAEFEKAGIILQLYALSLVFTPLATLLGYLLVAVGKQMQNIIGILAGIVVNIVLNLQLIHIWLSKGAVLATVVAELVVFLIHIYFVYELLQPSEILKDFSRYLPCAVIMGIMVSYLGEFLIRVCVNDVLLTFLQIVVGVLIYLLLLVFILNDEEVLQEMKRVLRMINRRKKV